MPEIQASMVRVEQTGSPTTINRATYISATPAPEVAAEWHVLVLVSRLGFFRLSRVGDRIRQVGSVQTLAHHALVFGDPGRPPTVRRSDDGPS
jgi:hypothetical protein